jgi:hypothetical protein
MQVQASKVAFNLFQKVVSKTKRNKFRVRDCSDLVWQEILDEFEIHYRTLI